MCKKRKVEVDCEQCDYHAHGPQTVVCCYYGTEDKDAEPYGDCDYFSPIESENGLSQIEQTAPRMTREEEIQYHATNSSASGGASQALGLTNADSDIIS